MSIPRAAIVLSAALLLTACGPFGSDEGASGGGSSEGETTSQSEGETETTTVAEEAVEEGEVDEREVELAEIGDSGISGTVTIAAGDGGKLSLMVELDDGYAATHGLEAQKGSCDDVADPGALDAVVSEVATYTLPDIEDGSMETDKGLPEDVVSEGTYALVVYEGEDVDGEPAACAEVEVE